jgi:uncharacterized protein (DUF488 family)
MNTHSTIYSIGHGTKSIEEFIEELRSFNIDYLIDVRSVPFSRWASQFNQGVIEHWLKQAGIKYAYMGDAIGGRPLNDNCYDEEGYFDYKKMAMEAVFQKGLQRLVNANNKRCMVAVMCSEAEPSECHRSKLIGRELYFNHDIEMQHIVASHKCVSQKEIMQQLDAQYGGWPYGNLMAEPVPPYFKSRKAYKKVEKKPHVLIQSASLG